MSEDGTECGIPVVWAGWGMVSSVGLLLTAATGDPGYLIVFPWIGLVVGIVWNELATDVGNATIGCSLRSGKDR